MMRSHHIIAHESFYTMRGGKCVTPNVSKSSSQPKLRIPMALQIYFSVIFKFFDFTIQTPDPKTMQKLATCIGMEWCARSNGTSTCLNNVKQKPLCDSLHSPPILDLPLSRKPIPISSYCTNLSVVNCSPYIGPYCHHHSASCTLLRRVAAVICSVQDWRRV